MNYEAYPLTTDKGNTRFYFQSIGKRGICEKAIFITTINKAMCNLALLDFDPLLQEYSDIAITDNGDMPQVLATVIAVVRVFLAENPDKALYFEGNTLARTRLYQISIGKVYSQLEGDLEIYGMKNGRWLRFEPNMNFEGFLVEKKS